MSFDQWKNSGAAHDAYQKWCEGQAELSPTDASVLGRLWLLRECLEDWRRGGEGWGGMTREDMHELSMQLLEMSRYMEKWRWGKG